MKSKASGEQKRVTPKTTSRRFAFVDIAELFALELRVGNGWKADVSDGVIAAAERAS